jgi:hypothetical protein
MSALLCIGFPVVSNEFCVMLTAVIDFGVLSVAGIISWCFHA